MADKKTRADLELLFSSGKIPTQSNFADLIASGFSQKDDGLQKASDTPLKIQAPVTVETDAKAPKDLILFYEKIEDDAAKWRMGMRSGGLEISRGAQSDFIIDANGNVGIGTQTPAARLSVSEESGTIAGGSQGTIVIDHENNGGASSIVFRSKVNRTSDYGYIQYQDAATVDGAGESSRLIIGVENDADDHLILKPTGNVGIGTMTPGFPLTFASLLGDKISLYGQSGNNYGFGIQSALLQIHTDAENANIAFGSGSSTSFKETMRIEGKGNVGIGTNTPAARLNVSEKSGTVAGASQGTIVIDHENNGGASSIVFRSKVNRTSDYAYIQYQDAATVDGSGESSRLIIGVENDADDHLILKPTGNVGIGMMTPGVALEVAQNKAIRLGNANISSGGDYVHLSNHSWYDGNAWQFDGNVGALYQINGQNHNWFRHDGKDHKTVMSINAAGLEVKGRIKDQTGFVAPVGSIIGFGGAAAPDGWLLCNGQAIPGDAYSELRAVLGGLNNVPDLRGRTLIAAASNHPLNQTGGEEMHTLSVAEMPSHNHAGFGEADGNWPYGTVGSRNNMGSKGSIDNDNYFYNTTSTGGSNPHNNMQPFYVVNYIIKY